VPPTSVSQVDAIANLQGIFESWRLGTPPDCRPTCTPLPGHPSMPAQEPPRLISLLPPTPVIPRLLVSSWSLLHFHHPLVSHLASKPLRNGSTSAMHLLQEW
jgi:hypothetical protein